MPDSQARQSKDFAAQVGLSGAVFLQHAFHLLSADIDTIEKATAGVVIRPETSPQ